MKTGILIGLFCLAFGSISQAQNSDVKAIESTIMGFAQAGDQSDAKAVATFLDDNYRVVMNRLFGSKDVAVIDKTAYLGKIRSKEWGGDTRKVTIENVVVNGATATAQVNLAGSKITFSSLFTLIKGADQEWKLVQDMPIIL